MAKLTSEYSINMLVIMKELGAVLKAFNLVLVDEVRIRCMLNKHSISSNSRLVGRVLTIFT